MCSSRVFRVTHLPSSGCVVCHVTCISLMRLVLVHTKREYFMCTHVLVGCYVTCMISGDIRITSSELISRTSLPPWHVSHVTFVISLLDVPSSLPLVRLCLFIIKSFIYAHPFTGETYVVRCIIMPSPEIV